MNGAQATITISRGGQQYGPYTLEQVNGYLQTGNLLPTDLVWNGQTWIPLSTLPGVAAAPPPPAPRERNVFLLVVMAIVWWIVMFIVIFFILAFFAGFIAGVMNPSNAREAGREAGQWIGIFFGLPVFFGTLGLSIWLTIIGKLPGTRK